MSSIVPFSFESRSIRVINIDGDPWFVGKDVAEVLGYKNHTDAITRHCKGVAKHYPLKTAGGTQDARIINEPDTFRLIVGSNLPEAQRFEQWLFEEVLPTIRKTGRYSAHKSRSNTGPHADLSEAIRIAKDAARLARAMGFSKNMIALSASHLAKMATGVDVLEYMGATHLVADERGRTYTPSELGKMLKPPVSGHKFNLLLEAAGLQVKEYGDWLPTDAAKGLFEWLDTGKRHSNGTPVKQIKWFSAVLDNVVAIQEEVKNNE